MANEPKSILYERWQRFNGGVSVTTVSGVLAHITLPSKGFDGLRVCDLDGVGERERLVALAPMMARELLDLEWFNHRCERCGMRLGYHEAECATGQLCDELRAIAASQ